MTEYPSTALPTSAPAGPVFVHSDALTTRTMVSRTTNRAELLLSHLERIRAIAGGRDVWFPAFNYDFPHSRVFNVTSDHSELGPISEYFRTSGADWRTRVPMFSACGVGVPPRMAFTVPAVTRPFGPDSIFAALYASNGSILWYGAPWSAATIIHYAEAFGGAPAYRYDKAFPGEVLEAEQRWKTILQYHVRPMTRPFDYAWERLYELASSQGIVTHLTRARGICFWASVRPLVRSWVELMAGDPLALLDAETRGWVAPMLERLGRGFELMDFERIEEARREPRDEETATTVP